MEVLKDRRLLSAVTCSGYLSIRDLQSGSVRRDRQAAFFLRRRVKPRPAWAQAEQGQGGGFGVGK